MVKFPQPDGGTNHELAHDSRPGLSPTPGCSSENLLSGLPVFCSWHLRGDLVLSGGERESIGDMQGDQK